jgi:hypothetical protein
LYACFHDKPRQHSCRLQQGVFGVLTACLPLPCLLGLHHTQINLVTSFNIVKAAVKGMIKEEGQQQHQQQKADSGGRIATSSSPTRRAGGSIVLVSAALASHGIPNYEAMSAAKAAVEGAGMLLLMGVLLLLLLLLISHGY